MSSIDIKELTISDVDDLYNFWSDPEIYWNSPMWFKGKDREGIRNIFHEVKRKIFKIFGFYIESEMIGYIEYCKNGNVLTGNCLAVKPAHQKTDVVIDMLYKAGYTANEEADIYMINNYTHPHLLSYYRRVGFKWKFGTNVILDCFTPLIHKSGLLTDEGFHIYEDLEYGRKKEFDSYYFNDKYVYEYIWRSEGTFLKIIIDPEIYGIIGIENTDVCILFRKDKNQFFLDCSNHCDKELSIALSNVEHTFTIEAHSTKVFQLISCEDSSILDLSMEFQYGIYKKKVPIKLDCRNQNQEEKIIKITKKRYTYEIDLDGGKISCLDHATGRALFRNFAYKLGDSDYFPFPMKLISDCRFFYRLEENNDTTQIKLWTRTNYFGNDIDVICNVQFTDIGFITNLEVRNLTEPIGITAGFESNLLHERISFLKDGKVFSPENSQYSFLMFDLLKKLGKVNAFVLNDEIYFKKYVFPSEFYKESRLFYYDNNLFCSYTITPNENNKTILSTKVEVGAGNLLSMMERTNESYQIILVDPKLAEDTFLIEKSKEIVNASSCLHGKPTFSVSECEKNRVSVITLQNERFEHIFAPTYNMGLIQLQQDKVDYLTSFFPYKRGNFRLRYFFGGITPYLYSNTQAFPGTIDQNLHQVAVKHLDKGLEFKLMLDDTSLRGIELTVQYLIYENGIGVNTLLHNHANCSYELNYLLRCCLAKELEEATQYEAEGRKVTLTQNAVLSTTNYCLVTSGPHQMLNLFPQNLQMNTTIAYGRVSDMGNIIDNKLSVRLSPNENISVNSSFLPLHINKGGES